MNDHFRFKSVALELFAFKAKGCDLCFKAKESPTVELKLAHERLRGFREEKIGSIKKESNRKQRNDG